MYLKVTGELNDKGLAARVDGEERPTVGRERAHVDDGALAPRQHFHWQLFFAADFCFLHVIFAPRHHGRKDRPGHAQHGVDVAVY